MSLENDRGHMRPVVVHVDAWSNGRRFTHDGTARGLCEIARAAGLGLGSVVATHLPDPVVMRLTTKGFIADGMEFERARRGGHPEVTADLVLPYLDPELAPLVESGEVLVVDRMSNEVPPALARQFEAARSRSSRVAVCHRRTDGQVLVVLDIGPVDQRNLRHEMIHAAQCLEDADAMGEALRSVAADGARLRTRVLEDHASNDDLRCLSWIESVCDTAAVRPKGEQDLLGSFMLALAIYPSRGMEEVARKQGIEGKPAAVAALFADQVARSGVDVPSLSALARELVAYRFEEGLEDGFDPIAASVIRHCGGPTPRP